MKQERNWLLVEGVPRLQALALETGLMIQLVDLFWGISEQAVLDPDLYDVHLEQIHYSRQYSAGPFFAVRYPTFILVLRMLRSYSVITILML